MRPERPEPLFEALAEHSPDAILRVARDGQVLYVNRSAATLLGRNAASLQDATGEAIDLPATVRTGIRRALRRCIAGKDGRSLVAVVDVGGSIRHFSIRVAATRDGAVTVPDTAWVIATDVTNDVAVARERDALHRQQQTAEADAEAASLARDRFLAIVSHELRSPLNGIQSWSHVLESQLVGPDRVNTVAARALAGIRAGIDQQVKLIEHLLDATVALTGDLSLEKEPMVVREAIEFAVSENRSAAIAKDVAVHVDMRLVDERMDGDPHRMRQVFIHLLSNALKFTPKGGSVWLAARSTDGKATIVVRDSGRGLSDGFEAWLFEPFRHADSSNTRRAAGIGLGLALARRLAELHGGQVSAESAGPHLGSTFTIVLPLLPAVTSPRPALEAFVPLRTSIELHGMTALIIDDQLEAREALSALLSQFGAIVKVAASSRDALALIGLDATLPDIVICDIAMPEEDGYGFARRFREYERTHPDPRTAPHGGRRARTPVIALSAFALNHRRESSAKHFDFHLAKPVSPQQLLSTLAKMTQLA